MFEPIRIESPDPSQAAYLMQQFVGRFRATLTERGDGRWEIRVDADTEPAHLLGDVLRVVQLWADSDDANTARLVFRGREFTFGRPELAGAA